MTITRISETKRGYFALFSEDGFLFSVDDDTLSRYDLHEGSSLSNEEFSSLMQASDTRRALERAMRLLARRAHSAYELKEKLCRYHDEYSAEAALEHLTEERLIDDLDFAVGRTEYLVGQGRSRREIADRLRMAGVDRHIIEDAIGQTEIDEVDKIVSIINKKYREKLLNEREKVMAAMARRGFSQSDILKAIRLTEQEEHE